MPSDDRGTRGEKAYEGKEIAESMARAQAALNLYDQTKKELAMRNIDPHTTEQLQQVHVNLDSAVFDCYTKLRKYIKIELEDKYWNRKVIGFNGNTPIVLGGRESSEVIIEDGEINIEEPEVNGELNDDILYLEDFQSEVKTEIRENRERFGEKKIQRSLKPALLPVDAYRKTIQYLDEVRNKLGFAPEAEQPPKETKITSDLIDEVKKWQEQKLQE